MLCRRPVAFRDRDENDRIMCARSFVETDRELDIVRLLRGESPSAEVDTKLRKEVVSGIGAGLTEMPEVEEGLGSVVRSSWLPKTKASNGEGKLDAGACSEAEVGAVIDKLPVTGDINNSLAMLLRECRRTGREPPSVEPGKGVDLCVRGETE